MKIKPMFIKTGEIMPSLDFFYLPYLYETGYWMVVNLIGISGVYIIDMLQSSHTHLPLNWHEI